MKITRPTLSPFLHGALLLITANTTTDSLAVESQPFQQLFKQVSQHLEQKTITTTKQTKEAVDRPLLSSPSTTILNDKSPIHGVIRVNGSIWKWKKNKWIEYHE